MPTSYLQAPSEWRPHKAKGMRPGGNDRVDYSPTGEVHAWDTETEQTLCGAAVPDPERYDPARFPLGFTRRGVVWNCEECERRASGPPD